MVSGKRFTVTVALAGLALLPLSLAGCGGGGGGGGGTAPASSGLGIMAQSSRPLTFPEFQQQIPTPPGVRRVEIEIDPESLPGPVGLGALEVEIQEQEDIFDEEEIKSRIVMIEADLEAQTGRITLELGNVIDFSEAGTEFKDDRSSSENLTFGGFVDAVQAALDELGPVPVKAERNPPATPQAPDDGSFVATELKLVDEDDVDGPEIEINVDADNLNTGPEKCDPALDKGIKVLDLCIDISGAQLEQEVEVEVEVEDIGALVEFEDPVVAVNVAAGTFTLANGTVVHVTADTVIDPEGDLFSLSDVASSVTAGDKVRAEGDATVSAGPPAALVATDVKFEVDQ